MLGVKVLDAEDVAEHKKKRREEKGKDTCRQGTRREKHGKHEKFEKLERGGQGGKVTEEGEAVDVFNRFFAEPQPVEHQREVGTRGASEETRVGSMPTPQGNHVNPAATRKEGFTVGDGGASWRMKALKRAQVQADEQGSSLRDVVSERWGSVAELAVGADKAAPMNAHRQFNRGMKSKMKRPGSISHADGRGDGLGNQSRDWRERRDAGRSAVEGAKRGDGSKRHRESQRHDYEDVVKRAARGINTFADDGSFMDQFHKTQEARASRQANDPSPRETTPSGKTHADPMSNAATEVDVNAPPAPRGPMVGDVVSSATGSSVPHDNNSVAAMLRARLTGSAPAAAHAQKDSHQGEQPETVHLPMVDARGRAAPGAFGRETSAQAHTKPTEEADLDLQTMVRRVRHGTEEGMNDIIARNIAKNTHYRDTAADDEYDFDVGTDVLTAQKVSKRGKRDPNAELERKEKARQVNEYRRMTKAQNQCRLCLDKNTSNAHLTVSVSSSAYLALPDRGRLVPGHCCVVPNDHIASSRLADETTWEEMRNFKKCVLQMMQSKGMDCIFFETALDVTNPVSKYHARVDCVPVSPQVMDKAPMYFKKAIEDATSDWSQHASKGCIETESRHLHRKIPPNFPYVHIEFGLSSGFVSVIDEPREFDRNFCRRVILGLLESSGNSNERNASAMQAKGSREGSEVQKAWTREFTSEYAAFDWVQ